MSWGDVGSTLLRIGENAEKKRTADNAEIYRRRALRVSADRQKAEDERQKLAAAQTEDKNKVAYEAIYGKGSTTGFDNRKDYLSRKKQKEAEIANQMTKLAMTSADNIKDNLFQGQKAGLEKNLINPDTDKEYEDTAPIGVDSNTGKWTNTEDAPKGTKVGDTFYSPWDKALLGAPDVDTSPQGIRAERAKQLAAIETQAGNLGINATTRANYSTLLENQKKRDGLAMQNRLLNNSTYNMDSGLYNKLGLQFSDRDKSDDILKRNEQIDSYLSQFKDGKAPTSGEVRKALAKSDPLSEIKKLESVKNRISKAGYDTTALDTQLAAAQKAYNTDLKDKRKIAKDTLDNAYETEKAIIDKEYKADTTTKAYRNKIDAKQPVMAIMDAFPNIAIDNLTPNSWGESDLPGFLKTEVELDKSSSTTIENALKTKLITNSDVIAILKVGGLDSWSIGDADIQVKAIDATKDLIKKASKNPEAAEKTRANTAAEAYKVALTNAAKKRELGLKSIGKIASDEERFNKLFKDRLTGNKYESKAYENLVKPKETKPKTEQEIVVGSTSADPSEEAKAIQDYYESYNLKSKAMLSDPNLNIPSRPTTPEVSGTSNPNVFTDTSTDRQYQTTMIDNLKHRLGVKPSLTEEDNNKLISLRRDLKSAERTGGKVGGMTAKEIKTKIYVLEGMTPKEIYELEKESSSNPVMNFLGKYIVP